MALWTRLELFESSRVEGGAPSAPWSCSCALARNTVVAAADAHGWCHLLDGGTLAERTAFVMHDGGCDGSPSCHSRSTAREVGLPASASRPTETR